MPTDANLKERVDTVVVNETTLDYKESMKEATDMPSVAASGAVYDGIAKWGDQSRPEETELGFEEGNRAQAWQTGKGNTEGDHEPIECVVAGRSDM